MSTSTETTAARVRLLPTTRVRWSAAARCPRWAVLAGQGVEPEPADEQTHLYWRRGKDIGRYVAERYQAKYGAENVILEKPVPWELGEAHPDVFIRSEGLPVEVKSTAAPSQILDDALMQLAGYVHFDPDAGQAGVLELVDPSTYQRRPIPFLLTPDWQARVEERVGVVRDALDGGSERIPDCVCDTPYACRWKGCPYTQVAWEGWQPPAPVQTDGEIATLARDLYLLKRREREAKEQASLVELERREIQGRLVELGLQPGVVYECGPVAVKRIAVNGRTTYDITAALKAGVVAPELVAPFAKVSSGYDRFDVTRMTDEPVATVKDYGEVPF